MELRAGEEKAKTSKFRERQCQSESDSVKVRSKGRFKHLQFGTNLKDRVFRVFKKKDTVDPLPCGDQKPPDNILNSHNGVPILSPTEEKSPIKPSNRHQFQEQLGQKLGTRPKTVYFAPRVKCPQESAEFYSLTSTSDEVSLPSISPSSGSSDVFPPASSAVTSTSAGVRTRLAVGRQINRRAPTVMLSAEENGQASANLFSNPATLQPVPEACDDQASDVQLAASLKQRQSSTTLTSATTPQPIPPKIPATSSGASPSSGLSSHSTSGRSTPAVFETLGSSAMAQNIRQLSATFGKQNRPLSGENQDGSTRSPTSPIRPRPLSSHHGSNSRCSPSPTQNIEDLSPKSLTFGVPTPFTKLSCESMPRLRNASSRSSSHADECRPLPPAFPTLGSSPNCGNSLEASAEWSTKVKPPESDPNNASCLSKSLTTSRKAYVKPHLTTSSGISKPSTNPCESSTDPITTKASTPASVSTEDTSSGHASRPSDLLPNSTTEYGLSCKVASKPDTVQSDNAPKIVDSPSRPLENTTASSSERPAVPSDTARLKLGKVSLNSLQKTANSGSLGKSPEPGSTTIEKPVLRQTEPLSRPKDQRIGDNDDTITSVSNRASIFGAVLKPVKSTAKAEIIRQPSPEGSMSLEQTNPFGDSKFSNLVKSFGQAR